MWKRSSGRSVLPRAAAQWSATLDEVAQRPVGVLDRAVGAGARSNVNTTRRIGERAMVRRRHHVREERAAGRMPLVEFAQRQREEILVGHAPDVLVVDVDLVGDRTAIDERVAVGAEEVLHVVEVAVASVQVDGLIALVGEHLADRVQVLVVRSLDDRVPRRGGQRERERLQSAHGPRSRCIEAREQHALCREPVEVRRQAARVPEAAEILGRQRLDRDQHDVEPLLRPGAVDSALERQRRVVGEVR
jgi:hypothetical protein